MGPAWSQQTSRNDAGPRGTDRRGSRQEADSEGQDPVATSRSGRAAPSRLGQGTHRA